mmetsp:Transcript_27353/g.80506  ORF Transcript_27353/g.80506 Transcript_27353/m.80506 type:complete len:165 (-) Transcript_27353:295-789(-)|eukprot:CAMPEP_0113551190 /NCGR_PEP_ID=MMETSP0015_2-20120614/14393_1 /TAXON_ID=2838 /ORGANISM="Odontella" /LENGTH=164 /DNA_ID=CAMNT_0000452067 /DNA_START=360 /DNA_END=854 /DNA_ORIENTATION=+ /assembly_acc=CAM_ASM_000160
MSSDENDYKDDTTVFGLDAPDLSSTHKTPLPTGVSITAPQGNHTSTNCQGHGETAGARARDFIIVIGVACFFFGLLFAVLLFNRWRRGGGAAEQPRAMENSGRWRRKVAPATLPPDAPADDIDAVVPQAEGDALDETEHTTNAEEEEFEDEENARAGATVVVEP